MATTGYEISPREVNNSGAKREYRVEEADDENAVVAWILANVPADVAGFPFADFTAREKDDDLPGVWDVNVQWGGDGGGGSLSAGESSYRFNFTAPSGHIKQSLATISITGDDFFWFPDDPPDFGGLINVVDFGTPEQRAEGFDLPPPPEVFSIPYTNTSAVITPAYQSLVRTLCGKVNSTLFYGAAAGELMLVRVNGEQSRGLWDIDFGFAYIANATSIPVGDITVAAKDGMDLLWALELTTKNETSNFLTARPAAAYVERVFERADLNLLNLPL